MLNNSKILVTGCSGLVGKNIVDKLIDLGLNPVRNYHTKLPIGHEDLNKNYIFADLTDKYSCDVVTQDIDVVIHCAAASFGAKVMKSNPTALVTPNIIMTTQLMDAAYKNGVKKFIFFASTTGYPANLTGSVKEEQMDGGEPYEHYFGVGHFKRYGEKLCQLYSRLGMTCISLRPTNIYGPNDKFNLDKCHVLPALINKIVNRQNPLEIFGDGTEERDLIYIDDMVNAVLLTIDKVHQYEAINIGCGQTVSINQLAKMIMDIENYYPEIKYIDGPRMISKREVCIDKAKNLLEFSPKVSLENGIRKTIEWYKNNV